MQRTVKIIQSGIDEGLHLGAQFFVSQNNRVMIDDGVGEASAGVPMTSESINLWYSSVKPIMPVALAILHQRGKLSFDDPVAKYVPEFSANGKDAITIRHCLTHTGGIRAWPNVPLSAPWNEIVDLICKMKIEPRWTPGEKAGYHTRTTWFILAELIRRIDGRTYDRFTREEIFLPLGMSDSWLCLSSDDYDRYAREHRLAAMIDTSKQPPDRSNAIQGIPTKSEASQVHPGGSGRGPIREISRFYSMLLSGGGDLLSRESVNNLISPARVGMYDNTFKHNMDWGLGFILQLQDGDPSTMPYGYGRFASRRTFGHSGAQSSSAFCDPEKQLIVAWVCNGMPGESRHYTRQRAINEAIYLDLSLGH